MAVGPKAVVASTSVLVDVLCPAMVVDSMAVPPPPGAVGADELAGGVVGPRGGTEGQAARAADAATPLREDGAGTLLRACLHLGVHAQAFDLERKVEGVGGRTTSATSRI